MRAILKLIGVALGFFVLLIILTGMVSFIRHNWFGGHTASSDHVRVIEVSGVIYSSSSLLKDLKEYLDNKHTKAIVLRVNSPGGLVAPSQEMYEAIKKADEKIPVVVSMGTVAASGGYYIALGGRKIIANPGTLTGSIGVIMEFINTKKLYEWAKLDRSSITSGKFKDAGSPLKTMSPEDKALFQAMVKDIYGQFRGTVKERRKLTEEELDEYTDGRVVTGGQAIKAKLVDSLGGIEEAIGEAKTLAKLPPTAPVLYPHKEQGLLRKLLVGEEEDEDASSRFFNSLTQAASIIPEAAGRPAWRILWLSPAQ
jgi:protease-4